MPYVMKFDQNALDKKNAYESLESKLELYYEKLQFAMSLVDTTKGSLKSTVQETGDLVGEYFDKYQDVSTDFFIHCDTIHTEFYDYMKALSSAITQCSTLKGEWESKIFTEVWEEEKEDVRDKNNQIRDR